MCVTAVDPKFPKQFSTSAKERVSWVLKGDTLALGPNYMDTIEPSAEMFIQHFGTATRVSRDHNYGRV